MPSFYFTLDQPQNLVSLISERMSVFSDGQFPVFLVLKKQKNMEHFFPKELLIFSALRPKITWSFLLSYQNKLNLCKWILCSLKSDVVFACQLVVSCKSVKDEQQARICRSTFYLFGKLRIKMHKSRETDCFMH